MNLPVIMGIATGVAVAYVFVAGVVFALLPLTWHPANRRDFALGWAVTLPTAGLAIAALWVGSRVFAVPSSVAAKLRAPKLPKAQVRK